MPLEELILRHALGEDVSARAAGRRRLPGVMMIPIPKAGIYESVEGVDGRGRPGIEEVIVTAKPGQRLVPLPEGASYLGFIFARAAIGRRSGSGVAPVARGAAIPHRDRARNLQRLTLFGGTKSGGSAAPSPKK